jgi:catechol 2,3-dioxygenase-like lactoylglutathione lyase family enzyme
MTIQRMDHVSIVVDDLAAATEFFVELGLVLQGEGPVEGRWVDRVVGLEGVRADIAMMQTPDGNGRLELVKFHSPSHQGNNRHAPANTPGIRHIAFAVEDIDTPSLPACEPAAPNSSASWSATRTSTALLRPRPGGNHHRASGADRLTGRVRCRLSEIRRVGAQVCSYSAGSSATFSSLGFEDRLTLSPAESRRP